MQNDHQPTINEQKSKQEDRKMVAHSHPIPFSMPLMGWTHCRGNSENLKMLHDLITKRLVNGISVLDIQIKFPCFQNTSLTTSPRSCLVENRPWDFRVQLSPLQMILGLYMTRWLCHQVSAEQSQLFHIF